MSFDDDVRDLPKRPLRIVITGPDDNEAPHIVHVAPLPSTMPNTERSRWVAFFQRVRRAFRHSEERAE